MNIIEATDVELLNLKRKSEAVKEELERRGFWHYPRGGRTYWTRTNRADLNLSMQGFSKAFGLGGYTAEQCEEMKSSARQRMDDDAALAAACPCFVVSNGGPPA